MDDLVERYDEQQASVTPFEIKLGSGPPRVLVLGAHADDIEIGCGGTLRLFLRKYPDARCDWVVFSGAGIRRDEALASARRYLGESADSSVRLHGFDDGRFPFFGREIKELFASELADLSPDLVFTHRTADLHQDHRVIAEITWQTFRRNTILEYEIAKYDGDLAPPNVFVPLPAEVVDIKISDLTDCFGSQAEKQWFSEETFRAVMRIRGIECASPSGYAEAFHARKVTLAL